jgi:hypothetical protein
VISSAPKANDEIKINVKKLSFIFR